MIDSPNSNVKRTKLYEVSPILPLTKDRGGGLELLATSHKEMFAF